MDINDNSSGHFPESREDGSTSGEDNHYSRVPDEKMRQGDCEEKRDNSTQQAEPELKFIEEDVYRVALNALNKSSILYAVGAAFARYSHTKIWRETKDLDIFLKPQDLKTAFEALEGIGYKNEVVAKHWLAKAHKNGHFIDLIFGTGHGQIAINDDSFEGSQPADVLGIPCLVFAIEEMIALASFIAARDRFDGAEVAHLIRSAKGEIDWDRVLERLGENRHLLLWQLVHFDFIYPGHSDYLPQELMASLFEEMRARWTWQGMDEKTFRGTLLDKDSYKVDVEDWDYEDARNMRPLVNEAGEAL